MRAASAPPHATLLDALEQGARDGAPWLTLQLAPGAPELLDARAALAGAHRYAAELLRRGLRRGERVLLLQPTSAAFVHGLLGSMLAGGVPVPLATPMVFGSLDRYLDNLSHVLADSGARHMIASRRICEAVARSGSAQARLQEVICTDAPPTGAGRHPALPSVEPADTAFIQYTSGTTGAPRGVVISQRAVVHNTAAIADALGITSADVGVSWLPLFHDMGLIGSVLTGLCHPYPMHLLTPERFLMAPDSWTDLMAELGATLSVAPNFGYEHAVHRARRSPKGLHTLRATLNGAEPVLPSTVQRFSARFADAGYDARAMLPVYGLAENTLAVSAPVPGLGARSLCLDRDVLQRERRAVGVAPGPDAREVSCLGRPVAGAEVRVQASDGRPAPPGGLGEVCVRGSSLMDGYFRNAEASEAALRDGWLHTGDLGFVHEAELYVTGRARELIIKAGRNIDPQDLEAVAAEVEGVVRGGVAAFGLPNPQTGTDDIVVLAEVRERPGGRRTDLARAIVGETLSALGIKPDRVLVRPAGSLPRTTSGKLQRARCAAWLREQDAG